MTIRAPDNITKLRSFFSEPRSPRQRQYEALRAYFFEQHPSAEVAKRFGYTPGTFRVLCHTFRRGELSDFFSVGRPGPRAQPKKSAAIEQIVALRKRNYSIYEISAELKAQGIPLSATAVREVLAAEGFARLPRRRDDERPTRIGPTIEAIADVRDFSLAPREFTTRVGGLFLFVPDLVRLNALALAERAKLPGSRMIPPLQGLLASLALELWSIERKSHIMALIADDGLGLFCGLNVIPKKSFLSEYSSRINPQKVASLLGAWHGALSGETILPGESFNLDFHSMPYFGEHEVFRFIAFWTRHHGSPPRHLVFDSKLTTYAGLDRLDEADITFLTLRRRSPALLREVVNLPASAWRTVTLDLPQRKYKTPRVYEQKVCPRSRTFRQFFIKDLGHDEPTILLTNDRRSTAGQLITRYAKRMLIENALADAVRFLHIDALSSSVGFKFDFDMALLVVASGLYRLMANRMRGYHDARARQIFRDLVDMPADVAITEREVTVRFHRRAHLPIVLASDLFKKSVAVPWWKELTLRFVE